MAKPAAFGLNVDPNTGSLAIAARIAAIADSAGLEYVGVQDHPYIPDFLDTFSLITWLASQTSQVHLFPNVANLPLRPPTMLAKQAASIDVLSGGRFELGLGAGGFTDRIAGMGGPERRPAVARAALSEAIDIIRAMWAGVPFDFEGSYYTVPAAEPGPRPAHQIRLWLGVRGPQSATLVGAKADGWSVTQPYVPEDRLPELHDAIDTAALEADRDPESITRLYNLMGLISDENTGPFHGPVERWVETLVSLYTDARMNAFVYWPSGDRERQSHLFAEEVAPLAREALGREADGS
jgi:alkanesulfonate monooxygenase SsuD/methylene tetrahydromethanopterin reductase-like flavin-dependent oxidoreductase (luciferase family)